MKNIDNQEKISKKLAIIIMGLLISGTTYADKPTSDPERIQKLFDTPKASEIIIAHNQRIANIEYEEQQVLDLINEFSSFQGRIDRAFTQENQRKEMKAVMDKEIEKYWTIVEKLKEIREILEEKPSFKYVNNK